MSKTNVMHEFKAFAAQFGSNLCWFEKPYDDYDSDELILLVSLPYNFVAKKMGINISVCVETAGEQDHYVVSYDGKIVLEDTDFAVTDFCWSSHEFKAWFNATMKSWREKLSLAKLLFNI
jgi:hypothetical protein